MTVRLLCLLLASLLLPAPEALAQQVQLRVAVQTSVKSPLMGVTLTRLKEEAERRSNGTLAVEIFDNGRLVGDAGMVDAVASGAVEIFAAFAFGVGAGADVAAGTVGIFITRRFCAVRHSGVVVAADAGA